MRINGKDSILQQLIFEVRYEKGYAYLDKCGRILNTITRELPQWVVRGDNVNPQAAGLANIINGMSLGFSSYSFALTLQQQIGGKSISDENLKEFAENADLIAPILIENIGIKEFTRMGFRAIYLFGSKNQNDASKWFLDLGFIKMSDSLGASFAGDIELPSFSVNIKTEDRKYRIAMSIHERLAQVDLGQQILSVPASSLPKAQKEHLLKQMAASKRIKENPEFGVMLDTDSYIEYPKDITPDHFITSSYYQLNEKLINEVKSQGGEGNV